MRDAIDLAGAQCDAMRRFGNPKPCGVFGVEPARHLRVAVVFQHGAADVESVGRARDSVQGVFHPSYRSLQAQAAVTVGAETDLSIIKGGGGEFERHPSKDAVVFGLRDGAHIQETAGHILHDTRKLHEAGKTVDLSDLWQGHVRDPFAIATITGTAALALWTLKAAPTPDEAHQLALGALGLASPHRKPVRMKTFPMFLQMAGRRVVIVGGGEQAAQKTRLILKTEAAVEIWAPTLDPELSGLADTGRITHRTGPITQDSFFRYRTGVHRIGVPRYRHGAACGGKGRRRDRQCGGPAPAV